MSGESLHRRIVVLLDGTWQKLADRTNVALFNDNIDDDWSGVHGVVQIKKHFPGVGARETGWFGWVRKLLSGAFGFGLAEPIKESFMWLSEKYEPGDEIFVFGFSRGAFSARSLVGLMHKVGGVLKNPTDDLVKKAYKLYRDANSDATDFRDNVVEARVKMIGVWDTVGALGIPVSGLPLGFPGRRDRYRFHNTNLSCIVDEAYHALAIDEYRADFAPTLWDATTSNDQRVEQCWFVGDHGDIGGGNRNSTLWILPYVWMQNKAIAAELRFRTTLQAGEQWQQAPNDSFRTFLFGLYRIYRLCIQHIRTLGQTVGEVLHPSVLDRVNDAPPEYRPGPLTKARIPYARIPNVEFQLPPRSPNRRQCNCRRA